MSSSEDSFFGSSDSEFESHLDADGGASIRSDKSTREGDELSSSNSSRPKTSSSSPSKSRKPSRRHHHRHRARAGTHHHHRRDGSDDSDSYHSSRRRDLRSSNSSAASPPPKRREENRRHHKGHSRKKRSSKKRVSSKGSSSRKKSLSQRAGSPSSRRHLTQEDVDEVSTADSPGGRKLRFSRSKSSESTKVAMEEDTIVPCNIKNNDPLGPSAVSFKPHGKGSKKKSTPRPANLASPTTIGDGSPLVSSLRSPMVAEELCGGDGPISPSMSHPLSSSKITSRRHTLQKSVGIKNLNECVENSMSGGHSEGQPNDKYVDLLRDGDVDDEVIGALADEKHVDRNTWRKSLKVFKKRNDELTPTHNISSSGSSFSSLDHGSSPMMQSRIKKSKKKSSHRLKDADNLQISAPSEVRRVGYLTEDLEWSGANDAFKLMEQIGQGAFGRVFLGVHMASGLRLAVKSLPLPLEATDEELKGLRKEFELLRGMKHVNVVSTWGVSFRVGALWVLMEYCEYGSVKDIMAHNGGALVENDIAFIMKDVIVGMDYLHNRGIVHRDIKAGNILITRECVVKIADFGTAGHDTGYANLKKQQFSTVVGTPLFMSPEVAGGSKYDIRADIWSLGITAIQMAEGKPPMSELHPLRAMMKISTGTGRRGLVDPEAATPDFNNFLALCLSVDPNHRPLAKGLLERSAFVRKAMAREHHSIKHLIERCKKAKKKVLKIDGDNLPADLQPRLQDNIMGDNSIIAAAAASDAAAAPAPAPAPAPALIKPLELNKDCRKLSSSSNDVRHHPVEVSTGRRRMSEGEIQSHYASTTGRRRSFAGTLSGRAPPPAPPDEKGSGRRSGRRSSSSIGRKSSINFDADSIRRGYECDDPRNTQKKSFHMKRRLFSSSPSTGVFTLRSSKSSSTSFTTEATDMSSTTDRSEHSTHSTPQSSSRTSQHAAIHTHAAASAHYHTGTSRPGGVGDGKKRSGFSLAAVQQMLDSPASTPTSVEGASAGDGGGVPSSIHGGGAPHSNKAENGAREGGGGGGADKVPSLEHRNGAAMGSTLSSCSASSTNSSFRSELAKGLTPKQIRDYKERARQQYALEARLERKTKISTNTDLGSAAAAADPSPPTNGVGASSASSASSSPSWHHRDVPSKDGAGDANLQEEVHALQLRVKQLEKELAAERRLRVAAEMKVEVLQRMREGRVPPNPPSSSTKT